jgi:predicted GH43/DUF377 family glycosyl hydrolase
MDTNNVRMHLFPIQNVSPIFTPQKQFIDRFGNANAYYPMNPSLYIAEDGQVTILVRRVNYRKFQDKQFILYEPKSISSYVILRGRMPEDGSPICSSSMTCEELGSLWPAKYPSYPTYWLGMEDIRFCNQSTLLLTAPEKNPSGQPCIFLGTLDATHVHSITRCEPSSIEKNWMPYTEQNGSMKIIYNVNPFQIKDLTTDTKATIPLSNELTKELEGYHGSTNGIPYKGCETWRLFLIHVNKERTYHKWLLYNPETTEVHVSKSFVFFEYSAIEFPCSLCEYNGVLYVSLGVNDDSAYIVAINPTSINSWFSL